MPALNLDAAFVHMNLGDAQGNAAYTGIDPYFDDLFLMAAAEALPVGRAGGAHRGTGQGRAAAGAADQPDDGRHRRRGPQRRPLHHRRTGLPPRREVPAALRRGGRRPTRRGSSSCRRTCPAARPTTRPPCGNFKSAPGGRASDVRDPCRGVRRRVRRTVPRRRRDHGQPDGDHGVDRRPAGPADLLPRHPADRRRGPAAGRHPRHRRGGRDRGLDAVRPGLRDAGLGPAPCGHGRQPD